MNYENKSTDELIKEAKGIYLDPSLSMEEIEAQCQPLIDEINKRFLEKAAKFGQTRRMPTIKKVQDLGRFRV